MIWHKGIPDNKVRVFLVVVVLLSTMLLPVMKVHPSLPSLRLEEGVLFGGWLFCLAAVVYRKVMARISSKKSEDSPDDDSVDMEVDRTVGRVINILFLFLVVSFCASSFYAVSFLHGSFSFRDIMELFIFAKYYLTLSLVVSIRLGPGEWRFLGAAVCVSALIMGIIGGIQYLNLANFNAWAAFLNPSHWDFYLGLPVRVLGALDNPNYLGILVVIMLSVFAMRYLFAEKSLKAFPWALLALMALLIKLVYLTISRSAVVGLALLFVFCSGWVLWRSAQKRKTLLRVGALFVVTAVLFLTGPGDFLSRMISGVDIAEDTSMAGRADRWAAAGDAAKTSPLLGVGSQKGVMSSIVDNEFLLYLRRYGILGLAAYLSFFLVPWFLAVKALRNAAKNNNAFSRGSPLPVELAPAAAYMLVLPSIFVFSFISGFFYNLQAMTVLAVLMGFACNAYAESKRSCQNEINGSESQGGQGEEVSGSPKGVYIPLDEGNVG
ncbi:MAG: O-antigen ligase family protein [Peptococcaceae bacterium]|nr:O-antigen ligase family protein [Peptococcaceae bacterium]